MLYQKLLDSLLLLEVYLVSCYVRNNLSKYGDLKHQRREKTGIIDRLSTPFILGLAMPMS